MSIPRGRNDWQAYMNQPVKITMTRGDWLTASARLELDAERLDQKSMEAADSDAGLSLASEAHDLAAIGGFIYGQAMGVESDA